MDPISQEYFNTVELVNDELESLKKEQNNLKRQILKLFHENKNLTNELRENIFIRDQKYSETGIHDLELKLVSANAAKDTALAMWQEAMHQLEKQEELLIGKRSLVESERNEVGKSIDQIKEHYQKGMMTLSTELLNIRRDYSSVKQELHTKSTELERCKTDLETSKTELTSNKKLLSEVSYAKTELEKEVSSLLARLSEVKNAFSTTKEKFNAVSSKNSELSSVISELNEKNEKLKFDIGILEKDAKESLFAAQEAILQKKEMAYREEQYLKEIEILKSTTGIDVQKVELKYKAKVKLIQEQNTEKIHSLMNDIQLLHKEIGEKQSMFEKVERERKALESKLELLFSETSNSFPTNNAMFDNLCKRLTATESAKDELELKLRSLETELDEIKSIKEQEVSSCIKENNILKERLSKLSKDCSQSLSDKCRLREELSVTKKKCYDFEKELNSTKTRQAQEMSSLKAEADRKQKMLKEQLQLVEEHYKTVCIELQGLLESQFKISNKWKEETEDLIITSESKIKELCDTMAHLQYQNEDLKCAMQQNSFYKL